MKSITSIILIIFSLNVLAQNQKLNLASDVWPPFTNTEKGKSVALDLVKIALERVNVDTKFTITDFKTVIAGIDNNTYDGSAALWYSEEREKTLIFSEPYLQNELVLVALKGVDVSIETVAELAGKKIGIIKGYAYGSRLLDAPNLELIFSENDQDNLEKLFDKKIDYLLVDNLLIQYLLKYEMNDVNKLLSISEVFFKTKTLHFVLNKNVENAQEIINKFNKKIKVMLKDGTYNEVLGLNWIEADVNNDGVTELILKGDAVGEKAPEVAYPIFNHDPEMHINKGYYINETYYENWDLVPDKYKHKFSVRPLDDIYTPGFKITF